MVAGELETKPITARNSYTTHPNVQWDPNPIECKQTLLKEETRYAQSNVKGSEQGYHKKMNPFSDVKRPLIKRQDIFILGLNFPTPNQK